MGGRGKGRGREGGGGEATLLPRARAGAAEMKRELAAGAKQTSTYARDTKVQTSTALRW